MYAEDEHSCTSSPLPPLLPCQQELIVVKDNRESMTETAMAEHLGRHPHQVRHARQVAARRAEAVQKEEKEEAEPVNKRLGPGYSEEVSLRLMLWQWHLQLQVGMCSVTHDSLHSADASISCTCMHRNRVHHHHHHLHSNTYNHMGT